MTVHFLHAVVAILLGLVVSGTVDVTTSSGNTHTVMWLAFTFSLALVACDAVLGGTLFCSDGETGCSPLQFRQGDL